MTTSNILDLSGIWEFCLDEDKAGIGKKYYEREFEDTITLSGTTAEAHKGIHGDRKETGYLTEPYHFEGYAWYSRTLEIPEEHIGDLAQLVIERTRISYVWLDENFVGMQDSFATAHKYDLTEYLTKVSHKLTIMVSNVDYKTPGGHMTSPDTQTNWNGMLGQITIIFEPIVRVSDLCVAASAERRNIEVKFSAQCHDSAMKGCREVRETLEMYSAQAVITCIALKNNERSVSADEKGMAYLSKTDQPLIEARRELILSSETTKYSWRIDIPEEQAIALWNEYTPNLYEVTVKIVTAENTLMQNGTSKDNAEKENMEKNSETLEQVLGQAATTIGFRDLHTKGRTFYLNDLPVMLRGKHDGMIFPLTGYAPMDKASWIKVFGVAREYGINHYRFHTCCPPEVAFEAADEMGIYLAPELPFWGTVAGEDESDAERVAREWLLQEGFRILRAFGNHPSFIIFSLGNELWGNQQVLNDILAQYKAADGRHWYVQGSNNFQFYPVILENDDFFSGVRFARERLFRGSYAMCDAPQGHIQTDMPDNCHSYDFAICSEQETAEWENGVQKPGQTPEELSDEVEIQFGTGTKKVKAQKQEELIPQVPVVSHEIGQYEIYPDYSEIEKYTGVLQPENLRIFRQRIEDKGMLHMAERFFRASGHLAVECYKRELETAFRSRELSGFQLLDLQDFTGQGTALVGILNSFMENKGLVSAKEWREFCNDRVVMLSFPTYVYQAGGQFDYEIQLCDMRPDDKIPVTISVTVTQHQSGTPDGCNVEEQNAGDYAEYDVEKVIACANHSATLEQTRLKNCGHGSLPLPDCKEPMELRVTVSVTPNEVGVDRNVGDDDGRIADITNHYDIYVYPAVEKRQAAGQRKTNGENRDCGIFEKKGQVVGEQAVIITNNAVQMMESLKEGRKVLYFGDNIQEVHSIAGTYCTDFWCYPMFASISESMGRPLPVGTMGLCMDREHPMFEKFPTKGCTTPQWWQIVTNARVAVLDEQPVEPLIWMIDNFGRNHKLGLVYESKVGTGSLLVCQSDLLGMDSPEVNWFYNSLLDYAESEKFAPKQEIAEEWLLKVYCADGSDEQRK